MNYNVSGKVLRVLQTVQVTDKFSKREVIIETDGQYPQQVIVQFCQDKTALLDKVSPGDMVSVDFNLRGRLFNDKNGVERCFNTLDGWRIGNIATPLDSVPENTYAPIPAQPQSNDLPF